MPYTLSHAIAAPPLAALCRHKVPLAALIVGSISPDFPYLLSLTTVHAPGHSLAGVWLYCFVPSIVVLIIWYRWLEAPILDLFWLPQRKQPLVGFNAYAAILVGILLGAYSHVLWDATSHANTVFVANSDFWQQEIFSLSLFQWNQYVSSVLGIIGLSAYYLVTVSIQRDKPYRGNFKLGLVIHILSIAFFVALANIIHMSDSLYKQIVNSSIGVMSGGAIGMCLYSLIINLRPVDNDPMDGAVGSHSCPG